MMAMACGGPRRQSNIEQTVLRRIRRLLRKPRGRERLIYRAIAAQLNAERLPMRAGENGREGTVRRILKRVRGLLSTAAQRESARP